MLITTLAVSVVCVSCRHVDHNNVYIHLKHILFKNWETIVFLSFIGQ
jgi:hypothetical protein